MSVFDLKKGESAVVKSVAVDGAAGERLASLGLKKGQKVTAVAFSLFKGSVLITIGYNRLAVRKSVAKRIEVEQC
ncbi:MAG: ferrous iron transport protein A [Clostridia bacterium]|nr:ferrous iron transport protein A [Clostridia bacterium]MDE7083825.1 ferrous iron transport protein A [Clostridia bacterium]MDE7257571.1 ferrous iron transport protein A [Clostridia bacterium]